MASILILALSLPQGPGVLVIRSRDASPEMEMDLPDLSRSDGLMLSQDELHERPRGLTGSHLPAVANRRSVDRLLRDRARTRREAPGAAPLALLQGGSLMNAMTTLTLADKIVKLCENVAMLKANRQLCSAGVITMIYTEMRRLKDIARAMSHELFITLQSRGPAALAAGAELIET
jgi:hypothetical protein